MALSWQICQKTLIAFHMTFYCKTPCTELWYECSQLDIWLPDRRKQRVKINSSFSSYLDLFQGVSQGSILEQLLFNLFLSDLFLLVEEADIMSYSDDNIRCVCSENVSVTIEKLEEVGKIRLEWFSNDFLKANVDIFHLILSTNEPFSLNTDNEVINLKNKLGFDAIYKARN